MYSKGQVKKEERQIDYLSQLMTWNPEAATLKPLIEKGFVVPAHLHFRDKSCFFTIRTMPCFLWYSRDVQTFGMKVSDRDDYWKKGSISGNEKKGCGCFRKETSEDD